MTADQPMPAPDDSQVAERVSLAQPPFPSAPHNAFRTVGKWAVDVYGVPLLNPAADQLRGHHRGRLALGVYTADRNAMRMGISRRWQF